MDDNDLPSSECSADAVERILSFLVSGARSGTSSPITVPSVETEFSVGEAEQNSVEEIDSILMLMDEEYPAQNSTMSVPPAGTETSVSVSIPSVAYSPISSSTEEESDSPSTSVAAPSDATPLRTFSKPELASLRNQAGGLFWLIICLMQDLGRIDVRSADLENLRQMIPDIPGKEILIPVLITAVQSLACLPDVKDVFFRWANQEGRRHLLNTDLAVVNIRSLQPWNKTNSWNFGLWSMAQQVATRFLDQEPFRTEEEFLSTLTDLFVAVDGEYWVLEILVLAMYNLKSAKWFWPNLFSAQRVLLN